MAKRFTDNEKWKKQFFKGLSTVNKLFFLYILDECNHAGIWHIEKDIAELRIGETIDLVKAKKQLGKHIMEFDKGEKWFIPFFIEFQYGKLNPAVNAHKSVIDILEKRGLTEFYEQFINSSRTVMDMDKDKDKDKDIDIIDSNNTIKDNIKESNLTKHTYPEEVLIQLSKSKKVWKEYHLQFIPISLHNETFIKNWVDWVDHLISKEKKPTENTAKRQLEKLSAVDNPNLWLNTAIEKGWQGLYEPPENKNTKPGEQVRVWYDDKGRKIETIPGDEYNVLVDGVKKHFHK